MVCRNKRIRASELTIGPDVIQAPATLYAQPGGGVSGAPNGEAVAYLNEDTGVSLRTGEVYRAPCGGLTNKPNGDPLFRLGEVQQATPNGIDFIDQNIFIDQNFFITELT